MRLSRRAFLAQAAVTAPPSAPRIVSVERVWGQAPHNAFTDLIRFRDRWYLAFREGAAHVSPDGWLRVLTSADGVRWQSSASLWTREADYRDPKLTIAPDGRLMLTAAAAYPEGSVVRHQTFVWFSTDGRDWTRPHPVGEYNQWLWRVTWHRGVAYCGGYRTVEPRLVRLYSSRDGLRFNPHVDNWFDRDAPSESSILFLPDESALCLLRRDRGTATAQLGRSRAPYRGWEWRDLGARIGGPHLIQLPDDRLVAAGRFHSGGAHTALAWLDPDLSRLTEFLTLPSSGDSSYPGLVVHDGLLWVSYYSSHEGKTSIYLARVEIPRQR